MLVTGLGLRLTDLDRYIASDEIRWVCRSINFTRAISQGEWTETFQVGHPGVVTMAVGSLAIPRGRVGAWWELCHITDGGRDFSEVDNAHLAEELHHLAELLFAARRGVAVASLVLVGLAAGLMLRLGWGWPATLAATALLAYDPFLLAHSRVLHLDALVALTSLAAVLAVAVAARAGSRRRAWAGAGLIAGTAVLAKSSALLLGPWVALVAAVEPRKGRAALSSLAVWGVGAALAIALWPAVWADPVGTLTGLFTKAAEEGGVPHSGGNFFLGRAVDDPGPLFYPVAMAFRMTPAGLVCVISALAAAAWATRGPSARGRSSLARPRGATALVGWALLFTLALTAGPKKFDRYGLPAMAALGASGAGVLVAGIAGRVGARPAWAAAAALAGFQALAAQRALPYPLAYYNPVLGGAAVAQSVVLVGWGEGYDLAARWLNALPDAEDLEVSVPGWANFAPLFDGRTRSAPGYRTGRTDYAVLYISKVQRRRYESRMDELHDAGGLTPEFVGHVAGIPYVWIYANDTLSPLGEYLDNHVRSGDVVVADGESVLARRYAGSGSLVAVWGHWTEADVEESLARDFPRDWRRAWIVRYPDHDPAAAVGLLSRLYSPVTTEVLADGRVEVTLVEREGG